MSKDVIKITASEAMQVGELFYKSGMFVDIKSAAQAITKIMAGQELGLPPFASMSGIHIIQGKPSIGAGLIAAKVKGSMKYDYKVTAMTDEICTIEYFEGKETIGISTFTIADARRADTKNINKFPRNMLFARAMSNGVKWYCPDIYDSPVYVPEELQESVTTIIEPNYKDQIAECKSVSDLTALKPLIPIEAWTTELREFAIAKHSALTVPATESFNPENL